MKILLTGTEGYLGCLLAPELLRDGHDVLGVDTGFYKAGWLYNGVDATPRTLVKDIRQLTVDDLAGIDAIVHMAELSNDPLGQLSPTITYEINHQGSVRLAELARSAGVSRFVYMSSCSVYGVADGEVDETSPVNPQTAYAECKTLVERDLSAMADDDFSPTFLRNATAFGASPRMRFDIVLNNLSGLAWTRSGSPWSATAHRGGRWCTRSTSPRRSAASWRRPASSCTARSSTSARPSRTTGSGRSPRSSARSSRAAS